MSTDSSKTEKFLGKIKTAEFGKIEGQPNWIGLHLHFSVEQLHIRKKEMIKAAHFNTLTLLNDRQPTLDSLGDVIYFVESTLREAGVSHVSQLENVPVELYVLDGEIINFRILTEVL